MNVYHASVDERGSWGYYLTIDLIVVANTATEALGLALESNTDTHFTQWIIEEIDMTQVGAYHISRSES